MLPRLEHYQRFGREMGQQIAPVDWSGFSQSKRWDHGIMPKLRAIAGYDDPTGAGTYTGCPNVHAFDAYDALIDGFRRGATVDAPDHE